MKTQQDAMDARYRSAALAGTAMLVLAVGIALTVPVGADEIVIYMLLGMAAGVGLAVLFALWLYRRSQERLLAILDPEALALATQLDLLTRNFQPVGNVEERVRRALQRERQSGSETSRTAFALLLHHRLKNSLQILASLLSLQIAREANEECTQVLRGVLLRLRVFGAVYRIAETEENDAVVDLGLIIDELVEHARRIYRLPPESVSLTIDLDVHAISAEAAIPLGLAVAEALVLIGRSGRHHSERSGNIHLRSDLTRSRFLLTVESDALADFVTETAESSSINRTFLTSYATQLMGALEFSAPPARPALTLSGPIPRSWN